MKKKDKPNSTSNFVAELEIFPQIELKMECAGSGWKRWCRSSIEFTLKKNILKLFFSQIRGAYAKFESQLVNCYNLWWCEIFCFQFGDKTCQLAYIIHTCFWPCWLLISHLSLMHAIKFTRNYSQSTWILFYLVKTQKYGKSVRATAVWRSVQSIMRVWGLWRVLAGDPKMFNCTAMN